MPRRERGIAIVSALWGSAIVAVIVLSVMQLVRADAGTGRSRLEVATLTAVADGAINLAILDMLGPTASQPPVNGIPVTVPFAGSDVLLSVRDEVGKIDLNLVNAATLRRVLLAVGATSDTAQRLADAIVAWRQPSTAGGGAGARQAPYQSVEELQLVPGMTRELYQQVAPLLTVYSHTPWVDPGRATMAVLGIFRSLDPGADAAYRRMEEEALGIRPPSPNPGVVLGHAYTITAEVRGPGPARVVRAATIRLTGQSQAPLLIYRWG